MTTVRISEGRPIPWRRIMWLAGWAISLLIVAGILGWLLWECRNEVANLEAEIAALKEQHAAQVAELVDEIARLSAAKEAEIATLKEQHAAQIAELADQIDWLNDDNALLEQEKADLEVELAACQNNVKGLIQRADRLEAELDACLIELNQPQRIQTLLPELLRDNTTTIFVVDDSGLMASEIIKVQEALREAQEKPVVNAQLSIMLFGDSHTTLFNFTDPATAPWDYAVGEIKAEHGGTDIDLALQTAFDSIKDEPNPSKRIVLLTDGHGFVDAATVAEIDRAKIPVDTIAFGPWSDYALLDKIAQTTGGDFAAAN